MTAKNRMRIYLTDENYQKIGELEKRYKTESYTETATGFLNYFLTKLQKKEEENNAKGI